MGLPDLAEANSCGASAEDVMVHLLGGLYVARSGYRMEVPEGCKRLLAFLALRRSRVERCHAAGTLWPCVDDRRAAGNLRSALWRLRCADIDVLEADKRSVGLRQGVADTGSARGVNRRRGICPGARPARRNIARVPCHLAGRCGPVRAEHLRAGRGDDRSVARRRRIAAAEAQAAPQQQREA